MEVGRSLEAGQRAEMGRVLMPERRSGAGGAMVMSVEDIARVGDAEIW